MDTREFPALPELATALPGYRLVRPVAVTAMSIVYQAEEIALDRDVALKILHPNITSDVSFQERFDREVSLAARIAHPNVIPIHAKGEREGIRYVAMPYVDGTDLGKLIREKRTLGLPETIRIIRQVAAALDAAHDKGLVHRDVKPGNVLLDRRCEHAYLCDFGIAKPVDTGGLTVTGHFIGTTGYASPEQIHGAKVGPKADQYALGCTIYRCLTGESPFPGSDTSAVLWSHMNEHPPKATDRVPQLPPAVDAVIVRAMAKRPEDRYGSCAELASALEEAAATATDHATAVTVPGGHAVAAPGGAGTGVDGRGVPAPGAAARWLRGLTRHLAALAHRSTGGQPAPQWQGSAATPVPGRPPSRRPVVWISGLTAVLLLGVAVLVWAQWAGGVTADMLERVPAQLRDSCEQLDSEGRPGASATLKCRDGAGLEAVFSFFDNTEDAVRSYDRTVRDAGVEPGTGDCATATMSEHQYPGVGASRGRVLCGARGRLTTMTWIDDGARTVADSEHTGTGDTDLITSWSRWVGVPGFATKAETALMSAIHHHQCHRAPRGTLDSFAGAVAAVECDPNNDAVRTVSAYRFPNPDVLRRAYDRHVAEVDAPAGVFCGDQPAGFKGTDDYVRFDIDAGHLLCYKNDNGELVVEWTVEQLRIAYRATGDDGEKLIDWWNDEGPTHEELARAVNEQADPPFPTAKEKDLLRRIPAPSQVNCIRLGRAALTELVDDDRVTGVNCGPTPGARYVNYLQFTDLESLRKEYGGPPGSKSSTCGGTSKSFHGDAEYERDGRFVGWLYCDVNDDGHRYLIWTHEPLKILVAAYRAEEPKQALEWWRTQAGPV